jgi:hypothetical protein
LWELYLYGGEYGYSTIEREAGEDGRRRQLYNYRMPSFRLVAKEKPADGRCRKVCEKEPGTPYERPMESPDVSEEYKAGLPRRRAGYKPVELNRRLSEATGQRLETTGEKSMVKEPPVRRMAGPR